MGNTEKLLDALPATLEEIHKAVLQQGANLQDDEYAYSLTLRKLFGRWPSETQIAIEVLAADGQWGLLYLAFHRLEDNQLKIALLDIAIEQRIIPILWEALSDVSGGPIKTRALEALLRFCAEDDSFRIRLCKYAIRAKFER